MAWLQSNAVSLSAESSSRSRPLLYLTALSGFLATCAFILQWRGDLPDSVFDDYGFEEIDLSELNVSSTLSSASSCADILGPSKEPSFPYYSWRPTSQSGPSHNALKVCITSTTSAGLEQILPWIFYHKIVGITHFILFVGGKSVSNNVAAVLESIREVKLIHRTKEFEELQANSPMWSDDSFDYFLYKPCNYELHINQSINMEMAIVMAREAAMDWIIHIDSDELLHPAGTRSYSVQELLSEVPQSVDVVRFIDYESCVERDDIKDPFSEVCMFKKGQHHILEETYNKYYKAVARGNPNYFLTYHLWKSGARVQDGLCQAGPHSWENDQRVANKTIFEEAAVLHYSHTRFSDTKSKRNRCNCKPTLEDAKKCFMLDFERNAFLVASTSTEKEMLDWYKKQVVWFDTELNAELQRPGVFERIHAPMVIVQGLKESGIFDDVIASTWKEPDQKS